MKRNAIKADLFAGDRQREKLDTRGVPVVPFERHVELAALAAAAERVAPLPTSAAGGNRPPYLTEALVRTCSVVLRQLRNLSHEQIEYQFLDRMSYLFCTWPSQSICLSAP